MKAIQLLILLLLNVTLISAQGSVGKKMGVDNGVFNRPLDEDKTDYQGSPYLYDDWNPVVITTMNGAEIKSDKSKFDIWKHRLIVEEDGQKIEANSHQILSFTLHANEKEHLKYIKVGIGADVKYAQMLKNGKLTILKVDDKKFKNPRSGESASGGYNKITVAKFTNSKSTYYITIDGSEPIELSRSSKGFAKAFPENQHRKIKSFIKSRKPNLKKDAELVEFVAYLEGQLTL